MSNYTNENGRSMVEMLGVLAVIGVLSVAGVMGFGIAMNKHKANELLNEASKRAAVVAMQVASGKTTYTIQEFAANNETLGFTGVEPVGDKQFKLTLTNIDSGVCKQVISTVGTKTKSVVQEVGDECSYLLYNNDLSQEKIEVVETGKDPVSCTKNSDCPSGEECVSLEKFGGIEFETYCRPKCPTGTQYYANTTDDEQYDIYKGACYSNPTEDATCNEVDGEYVCTCPTGFHYEGWSGDYCCPDGTSTPSASTLGTICITPVCTNGTWSASGTAYCLNGQWHVKSDFQCGDSDNPFSCSVSTRYHCEPFGECTCYNENKTFSSGCESSAPLEGEDM